jgi:hypothetical protein
MPNNPWKEPTEGLWEYLDAVLDQKSLHAHTVRMCKDRKQRNTTASKQDLQHQIHCIRRAVRKRCYRRR